MQFKPEKKLGFGLMRMPLNDRTNEADVDIEQVKKMVDLYLERGFTYFDTAWMYHAFSSENVVKEVLVDRYPRESYTLATKLHSGFFNTLEDRDRVFNIQLEKTGAGYFDYYLLHDIREESIGKYEELDCFRWLQEKKAQGLVRHGGFSYHDGPELLDRILTSHPEIEFVQLQINYLDWDSERVRSGDNYAVAEKHGKPVIVMEPVKGGTLANLPDAAAGLFTSRDASKSVPSWAIRFAASLPNVMVVLSGMSSIAQMADNLSYMENFVPLTEEEKKLCFLAAKAVNSRITVPCTSCHYCTDGCPQKICIPEYFSLYNEAKRGDLEEKARSAVWTNYDSLTKQFGSPGDCIECGQCESVCPQHLEIIRLLKDVDGYFGE